MSSQDDALKALIFLKGLQALKTQPDELERELGNHEKILAALDESYRELRTSLEPSSKEFDRIAAKQVIERAIIPPPRRRSIREIGQEITNALVSAGYFVESVVSQTNEHIFEMKDFRISYENDRYHIAINDYSFPTLKVVEFDSILPVIVAKWASDNGSNRRPVCFTEESKHCNFMQWIIGYKGSSKAIIDGLDVVFYARDALRRAGFPGAGITFYPQMPGVVKLDFCCFGCTPVFTCDLSSSYNIRQRKGVEYMGVDFEKFSEAMATFLKIKTGHLLSVEVKK